MCQFWYCHVCILNVSAGTSTLNLNSCFHDAVFVGFPKGTWWWNKWELLKETARDYAKHCTTMADTWTLTRVLRKLLLQNIFPKLELGVFSGSSECELGVFVLWILKLWACRKYIEPFEGCSFCRCCFLLLFCCCWCLRWKGVHVVSSICNYCVLHSAFVFLSLSPELDLFLTVKRDTIKIQSEVLFNCNCFTCIVC